MRPITSIIVPVYNVEKYLHKCINSVLNQTNGCFELILINDGSTDNSGTICDEYAQKDNRIRVKHIQNSGVSEARNIGIQTAIGEWLLFLDGDDTLEIDTIEIIKHNIMKYERIDMIIGSFKYTYNHNIVTADNSSFIRKGIEIVYEYGLWKVKTRIGSFTVRKEIVENHNILFNTTTKYGEDVEFINYCLVNSYKVKVTSEYFMNYVVHDQSAIAKISFDRYHVFESRLRTLKYIQQKFPKCKKIESLYKEYLLPEAVIDTTYLLCRNGVNIFKIKSFLEQRQYYKIIKAVKENKNTPVNIRTKINKFLRRPLLTWGECFLSTKYYNVRQSLGVLKRRVLN